MGAVTRMFAEHDHLEGIAEIPLLAGCCPLRNGENRPEAAQKDFPKADVPVTSDMGRGAKGAPRWNG
jgi:hypothetical protein